jgi:hypothetical protein
MLLAVKILGKPSLDGKSHLEQELLEDIFASSRAPSGSAIFPRTLHKQRDLAVMSKAVQEGRAST